METQRRVAGPVIENVNAKLATLERRSEYLARRAKDDDRKQSTREYDAQEASALKAACAALRYHRAQVQGEETAIPILAELRDAIEEAKVALPFEAATHVRVAEALARAAAFLDALPADVG